MKSYIVKEREDGTRYFDENTPAGNINPDVVGNGLEYSGGKLSVDATELAGAGLTEENGKLKVDSSALTDVVHLAGAETVTGAKTFTASPQVPTATTGDSSTKAANTAFVAGAIAEADGNVVHKTDIGDGLEIGSDNKLSVKVGEGIELSPDGVIETSIKVVDTTTDNRLIIYVRKTGSDANDGLTEATAVETLDRAFAIANMYTSVAVMYVENASSDITINIGEGEFGFYGVVCVSRLRGLRLVGAGRGITTIVPSLGRLESVESSFVTVIGLSIKGWVRSYHHTTINLGDVSLYYIRARNDGYVQLFGVIQFDAEGAPTNYSLIVGERRSWIYLQNAAVAGGEGAKKIILPPRELPGAVTSDSPAFVAISQGGFAYMETLNSFVKEGADDFKFLKYKVLTGAAMTIPSAVSRADIPGADYYRVDEGCSVYRDETFDNSSKLA